MSGNTPQNPDTRLLRQIHPNSLDTDGKLLEAARVTDVLLPFPKSEFIDRTWLDGLPRPLQSRTRFFSNQHEVLKSFGSASLETAIQTRSGVHQHLTGNVSDYFEHVRSQETNIEGSDSAIPTELGTPLGKGGYGTVFAVRLKRTDREHATERDRTSQNTSGPSNYMYSTASEFALKLFERPSPKDTVNVHKPWYSYPTRTQRSFQEELEALGYVWRQTDFRDRRFHRIRDNHMIEFIASFTTPKAFGLVLSPVALCDFDDLMVACGTGSTVEIKDVVLDRGIVDTWLFEAFGCLAAAVLFLESQGIRHGGIKPRDILLEQYTDEESYEQRTRIRLCDFATAEITPLGGEGYPENVSVGEQIVDTPHYTTPQRLTAEDRSYSDDMFTLGLTYLNLVTVVQGQEIYALQDFLKTTQQLDPKQPEDQGRESLGDFYRANQEYIPIFGHRCTSEKLREWLDRLRPPTSPGPTHPVLWVQNLLSRQPSDRWDAATLVGSIQNSGDAKFWGSCCKDLYTLSGSVKASCRSHKEEILFNGPVTRYDWKRVVKKGDQNIAQPEHRNGERCGIAIVKTGLLERRLVLAENWSFPQVFQVNVWISIAGVQLTYERGSSSVGLRWSDYCQLRMELDNTQQYKYWRGVDYDDYNNELTLKFGSPDEAQQLVTNLFWTYHVPDGIPEPIQEISSLKIMFINRQSQPSDRERNLIGSRFMVVARSSSSSTSESMPLSGSIRLYTFDDAKQGGLDIVVGETDIRICGLGSIDYVASRHYETVPPLPKHNTLPEISIEYGSLTIPCRLQRPVYICNDSRQEELPKTDLQGLLQILEGLTQWKIWVFCTVPEIKLRRPLGNEELGHGLLILWKSNSSGQHWFSFRLEDEKKSPSEEKWRYGRVLKIHPAGETLLYGLEAESCGIKDRLDVKAFDSASHSSAPRKREYFQFKLSDPYERLRSFLTGSEWHVSTDIETANRQAFDIEASSQDIGDFESSGSTASSEVSSEVLSHSSFTSGGSMADFLVTNRIADFMLQHLEIGSLLNEAALNTLIKSTEFQVHLGRLLQRYGSELLPIATLDVESEMATFIRYRSKNIAQVISQRLQRRKGSSTFDTIKESFPEPQSTDKQNLVGQYLGNQHSKTTLDKQPETEPAILADRNFNDELEEEVSDMVGVNEPLDDKSEGDPENEPDDEPENYISGRRYELRAYIEDHLQETTQFLSNKSPLDNLIRKLKKFVAPKESLATIVEEPEEPSSHVPSIIEVEEVEKQSAPEPEETNIAIAQVAESWKSAFPNLPSLVDKIWNSVIIYHNEPPVPEGMQRIRWVCDHCGTNLFDDFEMTNSIAIRSLKAQLRSTNPGQHGRTEKLKRVVTQIMIEAWTFISSMVRPQRATPSQNATGVLPMYDLRGSTTREKLYLLLCVDTGDFNTRLLQSEMQHVKNDRALFQLLRQEYYGDQNPKRWFTLRTVNTLHLRRFKLDFSEYPETHKHENLCQRLDCICLPPKASAGTGPDKEYRCGPAPEQPGTEPAIGCNRLTHYFYYPSAVDDSQVTILEQLPKRACGKLRAERQQEVLGWGIHFEEGWHWRTIKVLVIFFSLSSSAFGIAWSLIRGDMGDAFTVSGWWMALGAGLLSFLALRSKT